MPIAHPASNDREHRGVTLSSRYGKADELTLLSEMVDALSDDLVDLVETVFCDSKSFSFIVWIKPCAIEVARRIADSLDKICVQQCRGHNGMTFYGITECVDKDPHWPSMENAGGPIALPLRIRRISPECIAIEDAAGVKWARIYFENAAERRRLMKRMTEEQAVEAAKVMARALTDAACAQDQTQ